jgi:predicted amidohydrolase YtcJ
MLPAVALVFEGGPIRTLDAAAPLVPRLAVSGGRIAALPPPGAQRVNLGGRCVLPGFNDAHVHFPTWSLGLHQVRLEGVESRDAAVARVADALPGVRPGGWLRGLGWRDAGWTEPPSRAALDAVAPGVPVALMSRDYHSLWLNSAALARAGGHLDVPGGVVERDELGEPTGVLRENAAWHFRDRHALPSIDEMLDASREGLRVAATRGVTAIHDKDGWLGAFEVFQRLREEDELTLRVWQSQPAERLAHLREVGLRSGFGDDMLRLGYLKLFMDGTLGSATARLMDGSGVEITSRDELERVVREAAAAGWPVAVHAIGDGANRAALDAFEASAEAWRPLGLRQRIEHAQLLDPAELPRFAGTGVTASVQFSHAPSDRDLADRLWEGHQGAYAYRALLDHGARLANGSDAPVEELDPLRGIVAGVLRTLDERPAWRREQAVTVEQALRATCVEPAWLARDERRRGTLTPGMLADLVVLDRDPLACPPDQLPELRVLATMVGGRLIYVSEDSFSGISEGS